MLLANGSSLILSEHGLSPRALRDITAAIDSGRFSITDPELALTIAGGALYGLGTLLRHRPDRDDAEATDQVTESVQSIFGMVARQAQALCRRPLPDVSALQDSIGDPPTRIPAAEAP